jgi:hypothetical protein
MWGQERFGRTGAHAVRRRADAGTEPRLLLVYRLFVSSSLPGYALPTVRTRVLPSKPRSGGIRPSQTNCRPPHLRRGRGEPSGFPRGEAEGRSPSGLRDTDIGEVRSSTTPAALSAADRGLRYVRGAARPAPVGGASPATPHGARSPRDPRMWGQERFGRAGAHAVWCGARAGIDGRPLIMRHRGVAS